MDKSQELAAYDSFCHSLPGSSYLRPWLKGIRDQVEDSVRRDIIPAETPAETWHYCLKLREEAAADATRIKDAAKEAAAGILADAESRAKAITERAERYGDSVRRSLRDELSNLRRAIQCLDS